MKDDITGSPLETNTATEWQTLQDLSPEQIRLGIENDPDAHATDTRFWENAKIAVPKNKQTITIRLDADLLDWLRQEKGYQSRINAVLRAYMTACEKTKPV